MLTRARTLLVNPKVLIKGRDGPKSSPQKIFSVKSLRCLETRIPRD
jgi:hypothetical protein